MKRLTNFEKREIVEKTINELPQIFTSQEFNRLAVKNGYPYTGKKGLGNYIEQYAENEFPRSKTWVKKNTPKWIEILKKKENMPIVTMAQMTEQQMIEALKAKGYKIMRPVQNYEEI